MARCVKPNKSLKPNTADCWACDMCIEANTRAAVDIDYNVRGLKMLVPLESWNLMALALLRSRFMPLAWPLWPLLILMCLRLNCLLVQLINYSAPYYLVKLTKKVFLLFVLGNKLNSAPCTATMSLHIDIPKPAPFP